MTSGAKGPAADLAIEVAGLGRSFGSTVVLDGVDLALETGGVFGLLGPNGAGKTTTVRILTGVLRPDRADCVRVLGHDLPDRIAEVRPHIGVQTDTALYERLTGLDNLTFFGQLYGMTRDEATRSAVALLERFGLGDRQADRVATYSKGMKQKTLIARALIADPQIVFLDEPTAGLDPEAAHELMTYIHDLSSEQGRTFFITSHRLEEMESVCTKVGVLAGGRVAAQGAPAEVARHSGARGASAGHRGTRHGTRPAADRRTRRGPVRDAGGAVGRSSSSPAGRRSPPSCARSRPCRETCSVSPRNHPPSRRPTCASCTRTRPRPRAGVR